MSLNIVNLVGRVGMEPKPMVFQDTGNVLCTLTLAVRRRSKTDEPDWFNLEFWGKTAETAINYVHKGNLIGVQGALKIETWTDSKTGTLRSKPVIRVERLDLLGSKRDNDAGVMSHYDPHEI